MSRPIPKPHREPFDKMDVPVRGADNAIKEIERRGPGRVIRFTAKKLR